MNNLSIKLSEKENINTTIAFLIDISATQQAAAYTIIDILANDNQERDKLYTRFENNKKNIAKGIFEKLYESMGDTGIEEILNSLNK